MKLSVLTGPSAEPVSLEEMRAALWEYSTASDVEGRLTELIGAARERAEEFLGMSVAQKTLKLSFDAPPPSRLVLPLPPFVSLVSVKLFDREDGEHDETADWISDQPGGCIVRRDTAVRQDMALRQVNCAELVYVAGYSRESCPRTFKEAIKLCVKGMYEDIPESEWAPAFESKLWPERRVPV